MCVEIISDRTFMAVVVVKGTLASISIHYRPAVDSTSSNGPDSPVHASPPDRYSSLIPLEPMQEKRCAFGLKMLNNKLFACGKSPPPLTHTHKKQKKHTQFSGVVF